MHTHDSHKRLISARNFFFYMIAVTPERVLSFPERASSSSRGTCGKNFVVFGHRDDHLLSPGWFTGRIVATIRA